MAISSGPANLDISAILGKEWFVRIGADSNRLLPLTNVYSNRGCVTNLDCGGEGRGECLRGSCSCEAGFFGLRCHYDESKVCDHIRVNELTDEFTGLRRRVSVEFVVLRNDDNGKVVTAYEHPVYVEPDASQKDAGQVVDVIVYCGLRWLLTSIAVPDDGRLDLHFTDFHASSNTLQAIEAATEPVRFNTAVDERSAPVDLQWFIAGSSTISDMKPILTINTVLLCTKCDESNPCAFGNTCTKTTKTCNCKHGEKGSLCQVVPLGDGRCDPFFNKIEFDMDDGDCCEATCRSSDQFKCGVLTAESGIDSLQLGFPFCQDPKLGCASESNCWTPKSSHIPLLIGRSDGVSVHISANGRTIVISEPELDTVRVFDQEDRDWIQRGQTLEGHARSRFGTYVAISALPGTVVKRRSGRMPIFIAVASAGRAYNAVDVFSFEPYATLWEKVGQSLSFNQTIDSLTIGSSGSDIKVAVGLRENSTAMVYRVLTEAQAFDWQLYWKTFGSIVGLSGDGNYFFLTSVKPFTGSGAFDIRSVTSPDEELTNMMPFGVEKFYLEARPAYTLASYDGRVASLYGLPFAGPTGYDTVSVYGARRADTDDVYDGVTLLSFVDIDSYTLNQTSFAMSPDTMVSGINYGGYIELFNTEEGHAMFERNSSQIPKFKVNSHHNTFAISDGGHVMAVVLEDHVKVVQQNIACNATSVRLAITLDEVPESVSWSVDYVGFVGDRMFATENIRSCDHCYSGDPRYTRVVVVEDFCVPEELAPCIQVSFKIDRKLGDGAGFVGLKDGVTFVEYSGNHETVALVPGKCEWSCLNDNMAFAMVMSFDGDYPSRLETHQDEIILWSTKSKPLPRSGGPVLVKQCLESNQIDLLRVVRPDRGRGNGALEIYLDGKLEAKQVFDIGPVQIIDIASMVEREEVLKTVSAKCVNNNCPVCSVCSEGMIVAPSEKVDIGSFEGIFCPELNEIGLGGMISEEFCEIYPANVGTLCGCKVQGCQDDQVEMAVKVDFDRAPSEISFTVRNDNGVILWAHDFLAFKGNENLLAGQEETFKSCVPRYGALNFRISDSRGDGLCCIEGDIDVDTPLFTPSPDERGYEIYLGEELVSKRDFVFGDYQDLRLRAGEKSSPVNVDQHLFCENCLPCSVCPGAGSYGYAVLDQVSFEIEGTFECSHVNNWLGIIVDEAFCVKHQAHLASSCGCLSYEIVCEVGESKLSFELGAQQKYQSISLKVMNQYKDILFIKSGFNAITDDGLPYSMWKYEACIPSLERVYIEVYDSIWWNSSTYIENPLQFGLFVDGSSSWRDTFFGSTLEYVIGEEYTPSPTIPRTLPPTVTGAPVFQFEQREHPPCNICGEGKEITILEAILTLPGTTETASCVEAQQMANLGWVPPDQCSLVPFLVSEPCGCK